MSCDVSRKVCAEEWVGSSDESNVSWRMRGCEGCRERGQQGWSSGGRRAEAGRGTGCIALGEGEQQQQHSIEMWTSIHHGHACGSMTGAELDADSTRSPPKDACQGEGSTARASVERRVQAWGKASNDTHRACMRLGPRQKRRSRGQAPLAQGRGGCVGGQGGAGRREHRYGHERRQAHVFVRKKSGGGLGVRAKDPGDAGSAGASRRSWGCRAPAEPSEHPQSALGARPAALRARPAGSRRRPRRRRCRRPPPWPAAGTRCAQSGPSR